MIIPEDELQRLRDCVNPDIATPSVYSWTNSIRVDKDVVEELLRSYDLWQSYKKNEPKWHPGFNNLKQGEHACKLNQLMNGTCGICGKKIDNGIDVMEQCAKNMAEDQKLAPWKTINHSEYEQDYEDGKTL